MKSRIATINLRGLLDWLGDHAQDKDTIEGSCVCGAAVGQDINKCPLCGAHVIWRGSQKWKRLYGSPDKALDIAMSTPDESDELAGYMFRRGKLPGKFSTPQQLTRWLKIREGLLSLTIQGVIDSFDVSNYKKRRGLVPYVLNACEYKLRNRNEYTGGATTTEVEIDW